MLTLDEGTRVFLFTQATDMRSGFDRLASMVVQFLKRSPIEGGVFVFFSRKRHRVKLLYWDADGYCLWYKRLESGTFRVRRDERCEEITGVDLKLLLGGMDLNRILFRRTAREGVYTSAAA